jgi:hypothetical protein
VSTHPAAEDLVALLAAPPPGWSRVDGPLRQNLRNVVQDYGGSPSIRSSLRFNRFAAAAQDDVRSTSSADHPYSERDRVLRFATPGDAAGFFIAVASGTQPVYGSTAIRASLRSDGGEYGFIGRRTNSDGDHYGFAYALEGDVIVVGDFFDEQPVTVDEVRTAMARLVAPAAKGITAPVPDTLPTDIP